MPAIGWTAIEDALRAWVVASSGLADSQVYWSDRGGPVPTPPCIAMSIDDITPQGTDWVTYSNAPAPVTPGQELVSKAQGMRTATLTLQCKAPNPTTAAPTGAIVPGYTLTDVLSALPLYYQAIDDAGAGIGRASSTQTLPDMRGDILEPRAIATLELHLGSSIEGRETYIERTQVTITEDTSGRNVMTWIPSPPP